MAKNDQKPIVGSFAEEPTGFARAASESTLSKRAFVEVSQGGRIVIPAEFRKQMGIEEGSKLVLLLDGETLNIFTPEAGVRKAQRLVKQYSRSGKSMVDELLEDRRREAEEENKD